MRKAGVPQHVIMEITVHSTDEMFRRYETFEQDDKQAAARSLEMFPKNAYRNTCQTSK